MPVVSVVIPNYNHAQYLRQRIETVLHQTYRNFEIILLDDCSTDASREIIESYRGHEKVSCIAYNDVNSGSTFRQWVKGIGLCTGEYIWMAESDDWCECSFLENVLTGMLHTDGCVVGYCQSYCIENTNVIRWQSAHRCLNDSMDGRTFIEKYMLTNTAIFNASMAVWKKEIFPAVSPEFVNYRFCGDWLFWIELCRHGNVFISGKLLNYFRKHNNDVSSKANADGLYLVEELHMFTLLHGRGWISYKNFVAVLQNIYIRYKAAGDTLIPARKKEIEALLFRKPQKYHLKRFYLRFYVSNAVRKVVKAIIS